MPREMLYIRARNVFNISLNINSEASGADFCQVKVMLGNLEKESKRGWKQEKLLLELTFGIKYLNLSNYPPFEGVFMERGVKEWSPSRAEIIIGSYTSPPHSSSKSKVVLEFNQLKNDAHYVPKRYLHTNNIWKSGWKINSTNVPIISFPCSSKIIHSPKQYSTWLIMVECPSREPNHSKTTKREKGKQKGQDAKTII